MTLSLRPRRRRNAAGAPGCGQHLFTTPRQQVARLRTWNREHGWGLTEDDFAALPAAPAWPSGPLQAVVLVPSLGSLEVTTRLLWNVAANQHLGLMGTPGQCYLSVLNMPTPNDPALRWAVVDLSGGDWRGLSMGEVFDEEPDMDWAGIEVLAAAALFPRWVEATGLGVAPAVVAPALIDDETSGSPAVSRSRFEDLLTMQIALEEEPLHYHGLATLVSA